MFRAEAARFMTSDACKVITGTFKVRRTENKTTVAVDGLIFHFAQASQKFTHF